MLSKNQIIEVNIESISSEGSGVAKSDEGMTLFIPDTAVGDRIKAKVLKVKKTHGFAKVEEIITPSPDRITPVCGVSRQCGGCVYSHITYEAELKAKEKRVQDALQRIGGIDPLMRPIVGAESPEGYRNKAQIPVGLDAEGNVRMGFFSRHSHRIVECDNCMLEPRCFHEASRVLREYVKKYGVSVYDEVNHKGLLRHLYLRFGEKTGELMICVVVNGGGLPFEKELCEMFLSALPETKTILINSNKEKTNVVLGKNFRILFGSGTITDELCSLKFILSPQSFYQVNRNQAEVLYSIAKKYAELKESDTLLDLYCGTGTIGLSMADSCNSLIGVEIVPEAIENAKNNAEANGVTNARFIAADAAEAAKKLEKEGIAPDVVILDPPRKGCQQELLQTVADMSPTRVVYVSCDAATLARDLKIFEELGYITEEVTPVDMFPRTAHVESVARLSRQNNVHKMKLNAVPFEMIKSGEKTIELRLYDEKRQQIKEGDVITFTNTSNGERMRVTVKKLHRFDSFEALYKTLPLLQCGYTVEDIDTAHPFDMEQYYSADEQKKYGVVGIEVFLSKQFTD